MSDEQQDEFVRRAKALHETCVKPMSTIRTDSPDYAVLRDLALAVADALEKLTGDRTPWETPTTTRPERG